MNVMIRLEELFGVIYKLMTQTGREINVTDAWRYLKKNMRYEDGTIGIVYYDTGAAKTEKLQKESRERAASGEPDDTFMEPELRLHPVIDSRNLLSRMRSL